MAQASTSTWTTRRLLVWTTTHFTERGVDSPRVCAEMLLGHVLGVPRLKLYLEPDRPASDDERATFRDLVTRAGRHEPVDYLVGRAPFFGLEFAVDPSVLVPRPSTETVVEYVLQEVRARTRTDAAGRVDPAEQAQKAGEAGRPGGPAPAAATTGGGEADDAANRPVAAAAYARTPTATAATPLRIADVGTGSGAIALTLLRHLPAATAVATDLSEAALDTARQNADALGVADRVDFRGGDLLEPLAGERFDYLLSNPPYIPDAEWPAVPPNVKDHEPTKALRGGADGLDCLRPLIAGAADHLTEGGTALFEHAAAHAAHVRTLAGAAGFSRVRTLRDHEGLERVAVLTAGGA